MTGINTYKKNRSDQGPKRKGYQQDALFADRRVELSPVNKVVPSDEPERGIPLSWLHLPRLTAFII